MLKRLFGRDDEHEAEEKLERGLAKTRGGLFDRLMEVLGPVDITDDTWEQLEIQLIQSDVGPAKAVGIVDDLREKARHIGARRASELPEILHTIMVRELEPAEPTENGAVPADDGLPQPYVVLVVGVNGSGKTTTIAKLAARYKQAGRDVLLVAGDTFRAAAIDQLQLWGKRVGVPVVASEPGGDPGAVVYDALSSRAGKEADVVIIDTAGRLHTQRNLMDELQKVDRVIGRVVPDGPHETLLVLDATTGQNGLRQAKAFTDVVGVTGLALAKLDSSAKGGVAFSVAQDLGLPVLYVGTGEALDDLAPFEAEAYVDGLLGRLGASSSVR